MRVALFTVALATSISLGTASAEVVFRGTIGFTAVSNCEFNSEGDNYTSVYHPNQPASNEKFSGLTLLHQFGGHGYDVGGAFTPAFRAVRGIGLGWSGFTYNGAKLRVTSRTPPTITDATRTVILKGQIQRAQNDPGISNRPCIVTFEGAYRRDDNQ